MKKNNNLNKKNPLLFFINKGGYAITNYHVVGESKKINMSTKGKVYKASVIVQIKLMIWRF